MSEIRKLLVVSALASNLVLAGPGLDQAEVKLPYGELKSLITEATRPVPVPNPEPVSALLSARFRLNMVGKTPVLDSTFRTATFSDGLAMIPLTGGDVTVESQKPVDARILIDGKMLCQALEKTGAQVLEMRLLPSFGAEGAHLMVPACPGAIFETGDLGEEWSVAVKIDGREQLLESNRLVPLPLAGGSFEIRMLGGAETREALRPPEPSVWTWQNQALVTPGDGEISYQVLARASATGGSGIEATLVLPPDAREVKAAGNDLAGQRMVRGADRSLALRIEWKTRGQLEREVTISYQLPRRPLDRIWKLRAPAGPDKDSTHTRFVVVGSPEFSYSADGLTGPFPPKSLPAGFMVGLKGADCYQLEAADTAELTVKPPEPSVWTWQNQVLVVPGDGDIFYQVLARASATGGSGIDAMLALPGDAREVKAAGNDLAGQRMVRGADRSLALQIEWKTRGQLEREVTISYQLPRRPLDRIWKLQAPAGPGKDSTLTRFIVAGSPELTYKADGLAGPFSPKGLPAGFMEKLNGVNCYQLEAGGVVELAVNPLPMVATAEATVSEAIWSVKLEPDGAMMVEGAMNVEHRGMLGVTLDVPPGMTLLSCAVGGQSVTPVNLGEEKLEVSLPASGDKSRVSFTFTGRTTAIDPVEGTLALTLPKTSLFIRTLTWKIELPRGYQAETHGNLLRSTEPNEPPSRLTLRKNLCRDERPETNVFYRRSDLKN